MEFFNSFRDVQALLTQAYKAEKTTMVLHNGSVMTYDGYFTINVKVTASLLQIDDISSLDHVNLSQYYPLGAKQIEELYPYIQWPPHAMGYLVVVRIYIRPGH